VNQFACVKHEALFHGLRRLCEECKKVGGRSDAAENTAELDRTSTRIEALSQEICHLDCYVRFNYMGFKKITCKFDRHLGVSGSALFIGGLHCEPFCNIRFDDILILLGLAGLDGAQPSTGLRNRLKTACGSHQRALFEIRRSIGSSLKRSCCSRHAS